MKRNILLIAILLVLILSGCENEAIRNEEELIILQGVDATTLDPIMHTDTPTANVEYQIFDTLLKRDQDMNITSNVATDYKMINDYKWELIIRDDILFHDGEELKVEDVIFSIQRIINKENNSPRRGYYESIINIEQIATNSLIIETDEPNPILLSRLADLRVVPKHYIQEVGNSVFAQKPIGSGPYKFVEWIKDEQIVLVLNDKYWNNNDNNITKVIFKPVAETAARVMALQAKQADIITNVPPHQVKEIENGLGLTIANIDSTRFVMLSYTMSNELVSDVRVRKAINLAIDKESIIKNILLDYASLSTQPVSNLDLGYNKTIKNLEYDKEKAKKLIIESGSEELKLVLQSPSGRYLMDKEIAEAIKANLEEIGLQIDLQFVEWGNYVSSIISGDIRADMWLIGWSSATFDAGATLKQWLHTTQTMSQYKLSEERNKYMDGLLDLGLQTMDSFEREKIYKKIIEELSEDVPFVNLYQQQSIYGKTDRIIWTPRSDELISVTDISWAE